MLYIHLLSKVDLKLISVVQLRNDRFLWTATPFPFTLSSSAAHAVKKESRNAQESHGNKLPLWEVNQIDLL